MAAAVLVAAGCAGGAGAQVVSGERPPPTLDAAALRARPLQLDDEAQLRTGSGILSAVDGDGKVITFPTPHKNDADSLWGSTTNGPVDPPPK